MAGERGGEGGVNEPAQPHRTDPEELPLRVAERMGRLCYWIAGLDLTHRERALMLHLATEGGKHLDSWASQSYIGGRTGMSENTVRAAVTDLCERGLLTRSRRFRPDGTRTSDRIMLLPPPHLAILRQSERELAAVGHEDLIDFHHGLESRYAETAEPDSCRAAETADDPSTTYRDIDLERVEGYSATSAAPSPRPRRRRLLTPASDLFGRAA